MVFSFFVLSFIFDFGTDLPAKDGGKGSDKEDADDAHDESEDGREKEAPPFSLLHDMYHQSFPQSREVRLKMLTLRQSSSPTGS